MTDKLLCPFCNKPLQPTLRRPDEYWCENYDCPQTSITWVGTSALWQALIDTKKKLDVCEGALEEYKDWFNKSQERLKIAVDALDRMVIDDNVYGIIARNAIKEIKALEQGGNNDNNS